MNMLSLLPLFFVLLLGCADDDDSQSFATPTFCIDTDRYRHPDCTSLYKLSPEDHFAAVLGRWTFIVSVGTSFPITDPDSLCGSFNVDNGFIEFRPDSTVFLRDYQGEESVLPFSVTATASGSILVIEGRGGNCGSPHSGFDVICGTTAYFDEAPCDGPITLSVKTENGRPVSNE